MQGTDAKLIRKGGDHASPMQRQSCGLIANDGDLTAPIDAADLDDAALNAA